MRIPHPMKVLVLVFNKMMLNTVRIASDAPRITYVYVVTVDGRSLACLCMSVLVFAQNGKLSSRRVPGEKFFCLFLCSHIVVNAAYIRISVSR